MLLNTEVSFGETVAYFIPYYHKVKKTITGTQATITIWTATLSALPVVANR